MTIKDDFTTVINDLLLQKVDLVKKTITTDSLGNVTEIQNPHITINCSIQPVTQKNWNVLEMGLPVSGTMIGYFKTTYTQFSTDYEVEEDDEILKDGITYTVEKIVSKPEHAGEATFIKAILHRD